MDLATEFTRGLLLMGPTMTWRSGFSGDDAALVTRLLDAAGVSGCTLGTSNDENPTNVVVMASNGQMLEDATAWLRRMLEVACKGLGGPLRSLVQQGIGMQNIRLSAEGHFMCPPDSGPFQRLSDDHALRERPHVGKHAYCGGELHFLGATMDTNVIVCRKCYFRAPEFPIQIKTYGELRKYMLAQTTPSD